MVIHLTCRIPEVRVFPPDSNEGNVVNEERINNNRSNRCHSRPPPWSNQEMMESSVKSVSNESQVLETWQNPFHMRPAILTAFSSCQNGYRNTCRAHNVAIQRARSGWVSSAAKSLDLLRQNLQQHINREIDQVIKRYTDKFFIPAVENIKKTIGANSVSDEHMHTVCRQMLDEAKKMYSGGYARGSTPFGDNSDSETGSHTDGRANIYRQTQKRKRKESDTDSEISQYTVPTVKKKGRPPLSLSGRTTPMKHSKGIDNVKKEGPKWDSSRINNETFFIMGAKANKALGFGATRGRLYIKHPDVFKYCGDSEDKQWLYENNQMPATGGKAYMLLLEDIKDLVESDEYKNSSGLMLDELIGFQVPPHMQEKIRCNMHSQRTDVAPPKKNRGRPPNPTPEVVSSIRLNIPEKKDFEVENTADRYSDEDERHSLSKTSFELPDTGLLLFDETPTNAISSDQASYNMLTSINDKDSDQSQKLMEVDPPLSAPFDISGCS